MVWRAKKFGPKVTNAEMRFFFTGLKKAGVPFITQEPITGESGRKYLADGIVPFKINVEIDGASHDGYNQQVKDEKRDKDLRAAGWTVIRFRNWEVYKELGKCVQLVKKLHEESKSHSVNS